MIGPWLAAALCVAAGSVQAGSVRLCEQGTELSADQKDRRLRLVAQLRQELDAADTPAVLIARSGVDLSRFALRYSHAGISLRHSPNTPWSVRQLYYACDEGKPRLFDQGLAGFLLAADDGPGVHVSMVLLPAPESSALSATALDRTLALHLLAGTYSANAHAFSTRYQNCNQWVAELLAAAWGGLGSLPSREQAQGWLRAQDYQPHRFEVGSRLLAWLAQLVPLLHHDDHPATDVDAAVYRVSMPVALEAFVQRRVPGARRVELCHDERHIVVRQGWQPLGAGCEPGPGDRVIAFVDPMQGVPAGSH